jgi:hypothetical protein
MSESEFLLPQVEQAASVTVGVGEDEAALAQQVMHEARRVEATRLELAELYRAEMRRLKFALSELGKQYGDLD